MASLTQNYTRHIYVTKTTLHMVKFQNNLTKLYFIIEKFIYTISYIKVKYTQSKLNKNCNTKHRTNIMSYMGIRFS